MLDGLGIASYRSFGPELQRLGPLPKVAVLAGANNSGKSNVLRYLKLHYAVVAAHIQNARAVEQQFSDLHDGYRGTSVGPARLAVALRLGSDPASALIESRVERMEESRRSVARQWIETVYASPPLSDGTLAWFSYVSPGLNGSYEIDPDVLDAVQSAGILDDARWNRLFQRLTRRQGGTPRQWILGSLNALSAIHLPIPTVEFIPAFRKLGGPEPSSGYDHGGGGLIARLAQLQRPTFARQEDKRRFQQINRFLRTVLDDESVGLEVPHDGGELLVDIHGRVLPLESLGTGVHEVVILAAAATLIDDSVVCVEEPELHLHPILQRKLVRYLSDETSNQYVISTHSAHLLDSPGTAAFHIRLEDGQSKVDAVISPSERSAVCVDLGYRPSDLVQANCVIWVEGPSDRVYLRWWLKAAAADLHEAVDYSIMFYGGRLLTHLSADDPDVEDFISLRRLNRFIGIVIDSDKASAHQHLNKTKRRVRDEFQTGPGFAWVTRGREIENYVERTLLSAAVAKVHPLAQPLVKCDQYDNPLALKGPKGKQIVADKVRIAHQVARATPNLGQLDLRDRIAEVVSFIRAANSL